MSHPDFLPTGKPVVGFKRSFGELAESERFGVGVVGLHEGHTMLVALTGYGERRHRERSRAAGFDHHPTKPVHMSELEKLLPPRS